MDILFPYVTIEQEYGKKDRKSNYEKTTKLCRYHRGSADPDRCGSNHCGSSLFPVSYTHLDVYKRQEFDIPGIKEAGYEVTTPIVVTNSDEFNDVEMKAEGQVTVGVEMCIRDRHGTVESIF